MKKLLSLLSVLTTVGSASTVALGCSGSTTSNPVNIEKSFYKSYSTTQSDKGISDFGLVKDAATGIYTYTFRNCDFVLLKQLIKPKENAQITKLLTTTENEDFSPAGTQAVLLVAKTPDGIVTSHDNNIISLVFTLQLWKVETQSNNDLMYVNQNDSMDVTINVINSPFDISGVNVSDPGDFFATTSKTYADLNRNTAVMDLVINAINQSQPNTIQDNDWTHFTIINDQQPTANQEENKLVTFTVSAIASDQLIKNSFMFTLMLQPDARVDITSATISDPGNINPYLNNFYGQLNSDQRIINLIITALSPSTIVDQSDFTVTNDQVSNINQAPSVPVTFTIKASDLSSKIKGTFNFTITLTSQGLYDLSDGGTSHRTILFTEGQTYSQLNNSDDFINRILQDSIDNIYSGLWAQIKDNLSDNLTITNNQDPNALEVQGIVVTFTIAATQQSTMLVGSYTITLQLEDKV